MEQLYVLAPAILLTGFMLGMLVVYWLLARRRDLHLGSYKSNPIFGTFWAGYAVWLLRPVERLLLAHRISPTFITVLSLVACLGAGVFVALHHLAIGAWLYIIGGCLDLLDGRLARAQGRASRAGALFDSVSDRWAELGLFVGFTWFLRHENGWLLTAMLALAGSMMVSYTRARAEALGLDLSSGAMQRAERIMLVSVGMLAAAWFGSSPATHHYMVPIIGVTLGSCGVLATWTALGRWISAHRALVRASSNEG